MFNNPFRRYILGVQRSSSRMGELFHAIEAESGRQVMAQTLRVNVPLDRERLQNHSPMLVALRHNNVARLIEVSEFGGRPIFVYERLTGETLAERAAKSHQHPLPPNLLPYYLYQLAGALAYAEKFRIGHGALDANSIFLLPKGQLILTQMGLRGLLEHSGNARPDYTQIDMLALAQIIDALMPLSGENDDMERTLFRMSQGDPQMGYPNFSALVTDLEYMRANVRTTALRSGSGATARLEDMEGGPAAPALARSAAVAALYFPDTGQVLEINHLGEHTVGRRHQAQAIVPDLDLTNYNAYQGGLSKLHARILLTAERAEVYDMHSANGTFVNGLRLSPEQAAPLAHGDMLMFGKLKTQFLRYDGDQEPYPPGQNDPLPPEF